MLKQLNLKQALYNKNDFIFYLDSYKEEVLNVDFNGIDKGIDRFMPSVSNSIVEQLKHGDKIIMGVC